MYPCMMHDLNDRIQIYEYATKEYYITSDSICILLKKTGNIIYQIK